MTKDMPVLAVLDGPGARFGVVLGLWSVLIVMQAWGWVWAKASHAFYVTGCSEGL